MSPRKSHPKGIDPAFPQKNFVKAYYDNHNDPEGFFDYMYKSNGSFFGEGEIPTKKPSNFGHSIGQRAGKLRLSGTPGAHRIGRRK